MSVPDWIIDSSRLPASFRIPSEVAFGLKNGALYSRVARTLFLFNQERDVTSFTSQGFLTSQGEIIEHLGRSHAAAVMGVVMRGSPSASRGTGINNTEVAFVTRNLR